MDMPGSETPSRTGLLCNQPHLPKIRYLRQPARSSHGRPRTTYQVPLGTYSFPCVRDCDANPPPQSAHRANPDSRYRDSEYARLPVKCAVHPSSCACARAHSSSGTVRNPGAAVRIHSLSGRACWRCPPQRSRLRERFHTPRRPGRGVGGAQPERNPSPTRVNVRAGAAAPAHPPR